MSRSRALVRGAALGVLLGAAWGVLARAWMRLISTDPEFSWAGTLAIIGLAAALGLGAGLAGAARARGGSGWWRLAVLPGLLLFASPGMVWLPAFVLGGWGLGSRWRWPRLVAVATVVVPGVLLWREAPPAEQAVVPTVTFAAGWLLLAGALAWAGSFVFALRRRRDPG